MERVICVTPGDRVELGRAGENLARTVRFDISAWEKCYGQGTVVLLHRRGCDAAPYLCTVEVKDGWVEWPVTDAETAVAQQGKYELQYRVGEVLAKSSTGATRVFAALGDTTGPAPDPARSWVSTVVQAGETAAAACEGAEKARIAAEDAQTGAQAAAQRAEAALTQAPAIGAEGNWYVGGEDTGVRATGPAGPRGDTGPAGADAPQYEYYSNENLLINADFRDPVDTKQGYVVPPDTPYYSDTGLTTQAGNISAYTNAVKVNSTYGAITVGSAVYFVDWAKAVRGHVDAGGGIDGWWWWDRHLYLLGDGLRIPLVDYCVAQKLDRAMKNTLSGKTVTISALVSGGIIAKTFVWKQDGPEEVHGNGVGILAGGAVPGWGMDYPIFAVVALQDDVVVYAVKLELGDRQTLAHQDEDGNWVLNDPPNKGKQLILCSQYDENGDFKGSLYVTEKDTLGGVVLQSPNGTKYRITVDDNGTVSAGVV